MRDLEIRGAGNVLGAEQHGHMEAVGYDLYCKLLNQAVLELKGQRREEDTYETVVDCDIDAYIPVSYTHLLCRATWTGAKLCLWSCSRENEESAGYCDYECVLFE